MKNKPLRHTQRWLMRLAGLGGVFSCLFLVVWGLAFISAEHYLLRSRQSRLEPQITRLEQSFKSLQVTGEALSLSLANQLKQGDFSWEALGDARLAARPFFKIYLLNQAGNTQYSEAASEIPTPWLVNKVQQKVQADDRLITIRPLPPGADFSLTNTVSPYPEPEAYWVWAIKKHGSVLIIETQLDYLWGPWLTQQLQELNLQDDVTVQHLNRQKSQAPLTMTPKNWDDRWMSALSNIWRNRQWVISIQTFTSDDNFVFDHVQLTIDNWPEIKKVGYRYLAIAAFALLFFAGFLAAIRLAARSLQQEVDLAYLRANFTAMVSHELKTPVSIIQLYSEMLEHRLIQDPDQVNSYHQTIGLEARRLGRLIENLLSLAKIEQGKSSYYLEASDLNELVAEAITQTTLFLGTEATERIERQLTDSPLMVDVDRAASIQAIANLIHNSIKYGDPQESIIVCTQKLSDGAIVEIKDRGPGIPTEEQVRIFDPYMRLEDESRRKSQGTGLGLALVKAYMEAQGGRVWVENRQGGGSTFTLHFQPIGKGV